MGCLGFALTVLRLFDGRFSRSESRVSDSIFKCHLIPYHSVGIVYVVLSAVLYVISYFRQRHSQHDFADHATIHPALLTKGQENQRIFGRPFVTAGWIVVLVAFAVAAIEITLFVLVLDI